VGDAVGAGVGILYSVNTSTYVQAEVLTDLGGTNASIYWALGAWADYKYWPSSVALAEGRLWWTGKDTIDASVSDDYFNYDPTVEGDSGPITRTLGSGPVNKINWILSLQRILVGGDGAEFVVRSNSFDEPLTPTNFTIKNPSNQGSAQIQAVKIDRTGIYAQRGGTRVMELSYDGTDLEYSSTDLTVLSPEVCEPQIKRIAIQRQPDTRIHCVLSDGTVAILIYDRAENVRCWVKYETDGLVEDAVVLVSAAGETEDNVYYVVNRTINGATVRYLEKWAKESECEGAAVNKNLDSHIIYSGSSTTIMTGLSHLEGESVKVWAGKDLGSYTVSAGSITLSEAVTSAVIGLSYTAQWQSSKLAYGAREGTALLQKKNINNLGVILRNTHYQGLKYGPNFSTLDDLPLVQGAAAIADDTIHTSYDEETFSFQGRWDTDARLCLQSQSPNPCNVLAAIIGLEINEKF